PDEILASGKFGLSWSRVLYLPPLWLAGIQRQAFASYLTKILGIQVQYVPGTHQEHTIMSWNNLANKSTGWQAQALELMSVRDIKDLNLQNEIACSSCRVSPSECDPGRLDYLKNCQFIV